MCVSEFTVFQKTYNTMEHVHFVSLQGVVGVYLMIFGLKVEGSVHSRWNFTFLGDISICGSC